MEKSPKPLSVTEISDFLITLDKKRCPWCDGSHWGVHTDAGDDENAAGQPGLRALSRLRIEQSVQGSLKGTITTGTDVSLAVAVVECLECGYLYLFNYFKIMNRVRTPRSEIDDGQPSSN